MSTGLVGADVGSLRAFAVHCDRAAQELAATRDRLTAGLVGLSWHGPDAERARSQWHERDVPAIGSVLAAIVQAAERVRHEADDQERTSTDQVALALAGAGLGAGAGYAAGSTPDDARRETSESRWARWRTAGLGALLGFKVGGPQGAVLGAIVGPAALDRITDIAADRAQRTYITEVGSAQPVAVPGSVGDLFASVEDAYAVGGGGVIVDTVTATDGSRTHFVYSAGTEKWVNAGDRINDGSAAIASGMGRINANQVATIQALEAANVGADDRVILVGHSQSSKTQMNMAADSYVLSRYNIHGVVTSGAGGGNYDVPEHIQLIGYRNTVDGVTKIGGTPERGIHVESRWWTDRHAISRYTEMARNEYRPEVAAWMRDLGLSDGHAERRIYRGQVAPRP